MRMGIYSPQSTQSPTEFYLFFLHFVIQTIDERTTLNIKELCDTQCYSVVNYHQHILW